MPRSILKAATDCEAQRRWPLARVLSSPLVFRRVSVPRRLLRALKMCYKNFSSNAIAILNIGPVTVIVKLSPKAQEKIRTLIEAQVFPTRAAAAAFFIEEGLSVQGLLFEAVRNRLSQIEKLNQEMLDFIEQKSYEIKQVQSDLKGLVKNGSTPSAANAGTNSEKDK